MEQECFWLNSTKIEGVKRRDRYNAKERIHQWGREIEEVLQREFQEIPKREEALCGKK